jgi:hypothetical protein
MQAVIETKQDGSVAIELDGEAARAMVASVVFASRFHDGIAPLAAMVEAGLRDDHSVPARRTPCQ